MIRIATLLALCGMSVLYGAPMADHRYALNIARETLDNALKDLAHQTGVQIGRFSESADGERVVGPLVGEYSVPAALEALLRDTGLTYKPINDRMVAVVKAQPGDSNPASKAHPREPPAHAPPARGPPDAGGAATPDEQVLITGSRIRAANPTSAITVVSREMIEPAGYSTLQDVISSLPQFLSTINSVRSLSQPVGSDNVPVGSAAQGEVGVNLRGLGEEATLVLINGRRTATSAGFAGQSYNVAAIPVAAIERIEILSDSAAAVYGSDAIAGVVNIVLRRNYSGSTTGLAYSQGANGGDETRLDQLLGSSWNSGSVTAVFSGAHAMPIDSARTGYTTNNLVGRGGIDGRSQGTGQPGLITDLAGNTLGSLPASFNGTEAWTAADLAAAHFQPADLVPRDQSSDNRSYQLYLYAQQELTGRAQLIGDVRWSDEHTEAMGAPPLFFTDIDASNPYNRLGETVSAAYAPVYEVTHGLIPRTALGNVLKDLSVDVGLRVALPVRDWSVDMEATHSLARSRSSNFSDELYDPAAADGLTLLGRLAPTQLNPFGNGSAQNLTLLRANYGPESRISDRKSQLDMLTFALEGGLLSLRRGDLRAAVGAEFRRESLVFASDDDFAIESLDDFRPARAVAAVFGEASIPLLSGLTASLQARWEHYEVASSESVIDGLVFSKLSPRAGLAWNAAPGLMLRASWGRSFKAPGLADLVQKPIPATAAVAQYDPLKNEVVPVYFDFAPNPHLRPERGETLTAGFDWAAPFARGLEIAAGFNRTHFYDEVSGDLLNSLGTVPISDVLARPDLFPGVAVRDSNGTLIRFEDSAFNLASLTVKSLDLGLTYLLETGWGRFTAGLQIALTLAFNQQLVPLDSVQSLAGTSAMDRRRAVASLGWQKGALGLQTYVHYTGAYRDTELLGGYFGPDAPVIPVPSRTTWDVTTRWQAGRGFELSAGVLNLLDAKFPFAQGPAGPYDTIRVDLRGRVVFARIQKSVSF